MNTLRTLSIVVVGVVVVVTGCTPLSASRRGDQPLLQRDVGVLDVPSSTTQRVLIDDAPPDDDDVRGRIAAAASSSVGQKALIVGGVRYRFDCSGIASGIYARAGLPLGDDRWGGGNVRSLFALVEKRGSLRRSHPLRGDFVFFDNSYDSNDNGIIDDPLSHVGVVESVEDDGTVIFVHRIGSQIVRGRMNLDHPSDRRDKTGKALNHYLRAAHGGIPQRTTAELFVAYGSLPVDGPRLADNQTDRHR